MHSKAFPIVVLFLAVISACAETASAQKLGKEAARDKALEEADRKAFEANMTVYKDEVKPFLENHCIACHGPKKLEGDL